MFNLLDVFNHNFQSISDRCRIKCKRYLQSVLTEGEKLGRKGKTQIEIEKLKWELKQKYQILGKYVTSQKEKKSVIDFSHDQEYLNQINDIIKLKFYIEERSKTKGEI